MAEYTLKEFLQGKTQVQVAAMLDVTQGYISQMLAGDRDIRVKTDIDGNVLETWEVKPIGKRTA